MPGAQTATSDESDLDQLDEDQTTEEAGAPSEESTDPEESPQEPASEGVVVSFGDEPQEDEDSPPPDLSPKANAAWVKKRQEAKALKQALRDREAELQQLRSAVQPQAETLGQRPALADFDFDEEKHAQALDEWYARKLKHDERVRQQQQAQEAQQKAWQTRLNEYGQKKAALKVPDFDEAEAAASEKLSVVQRGIIVKGCKDPAAMMYALGKSSEKLGQIAAISDPVDFAFAVADLQKELKVTERKAPPVPERKISGGAAGAALTNAKLEQLRNKARETGDYTEYHRAKAALQSK